MAEMTREKEAQSVMCQEPNGRGAVGPRAQAAVSSTPHSLDYKFHEHKDLSVFFFPYLTSSP